MHFMGGGRYRLYLSHDLTGRFGRVFLPKKGKRPYSANFSRVRRRRHGSCLGMVSFNSRDRRSRGGGRHWMDSCRGRIYPGKHVSHESGLYPSASIRAQLSPRVFLPHGSGRRCWYWQLLYIIFRKVWR